MISLSRRIAALRHLGPVVLLVLMAFPAEAGWIEDRADPATGATQTVIHVKLFALPDPTRTDTASRADVEVVKAFTRRFPGIFAER
ncbi:MAG: hypothetical protein JXB04_12680 [Kiritimatiellae bacterium]|nr:hypothetical protein [Kiritimatiellia bacterium]